MSACAWSRHTQKKLGNANSAGPPGSKSVGVSWKNEGYSGRLTIFRVTVQCHPPMMHVGYGVVERCSVLAALLLLCPWWSWWGVVVILWLWRDVVRWRRGETQQWGMQTIGGMFRRPHQTCYFCCSGEFRRQHVVILIMQRVVGHSPSPDTHTHTCALTNKSPLKLLFHTFQLVPWICYCNNWCKEIELQGLLAVYLAQGSYLPHSNMALKRLRERSL